MKVSICDKLVYEFQRFAKKALTYSDDDLITYGFPEDIW